MHENYELVQKGFRILHPLMAGFIGRELNRVYHDRWWTTVRLNLADPKLPMSGNYDYLIDSLDVSNCIRIIDRFWNEVFRERVDVSCRIWAKELMGVRNKAAHIGGQDFSNEDTERALDTMARLCKLFDETGAEEIRELYNKVRYAGNNNANNTESGPVPVDVASDNNVKAGGIDLTSGNLLDYVGTEYVQKTNLTRKVTFAGKTEAYPVYKVRLDALYYNDQNDRIATWITRYKAENGTDSLGRLRGEEYNNVIEGFIADSNLEAIQKTQKNIMLVGQREPGVALSDGRIVDGNRRYTCLRRIQRASQEQVYFETVIMNVDIKKDKKQIKLLELAIQHGEEKKVDYDLIDYAVGTYNDIVKTELLTIEEYAASTNETLGEVRTRIEVATIINEFLEYVKLPEQYHVAREYQMYSLIQEMLAPLKKVTGDEKETLKRIVFNNVFMKGVKDQRKFIRDIKMLVSNNAYTSFFKEQLEISRKIHNKFDLVTIKNKTDIDNFAQENVILADELQHSIERALYRSRKQKLIALPAENADKSFNLIMEIDTRLFDKMEESEKEILKEKISTLSSAVSSISSLLGGEETSNETTIERNVDTVTKVKAGEFKAALIDSTKPYVICKTLGNVITRYFVSLRFIGVSVNPDAAGVGEYKIRFVDDMGKVISDEKIVEIEAGRESVVNLSLKADSINIKNCKLVVSYADKADDEAIILAPFDVKIVSSFAR